jgi:hypothetical protein
MAAVGTEKQSASKCVSHQNKAVLQLRGPGRTFNYPSNHGGIKRRGSLWRGISARRTAAQ